MASSLAAPAPHDTQAARLLGRILGGRYLGPYLPGEPSGLVATMAARRLAPGFVDQLARIYGVREWDFDAFRRAFVEGALLAWQGASVVEEYEDGVRVVSSTCPILPLAGSDPRACQMCRAFQAEVAREALGEAFQEVDWESTILQGAPECRRTFVRAPGAAGLR